MIRKRYKSLIALGKGPTTSSLALIGSILLGGILANILSSPSAFAEVSSDLKYVELAIGTPSAIGDDATTNSGTSHLLNGQVLAPQDEATAVAKHYYVPVTVTLTQAGDYHVSVKAKDNPNLLGTTGDQPLLDENNHQISIPTVSSASTLAQLKDNWGFRYKEVTEEELSTVTNDTFSDDTSELSFIAMPASDATPVTVLQGDNAGTATKYVLLDFGAGVTGKIPSGNYSTKVLVTAVAKPQAVANLKTFFTISTMQEMDGNICNTVLTPNPTATSLANATQYAAAATDANKKNLIPEVTLTDERDGKTYVVRKMPDGNCWMAQNLDLDLHIGTTEGANCTAGDSSTSGDMGTCKDGKFVKLTSGNSNISSATWNISGSNKGYATQTALGTTWDDYGRAGGATNTYEVRSYDSGDKCATASGSKDSADTVAACAAGTRGAAHVGNYYNWPAVTAGTGTYAASTNGTNVDSSICPKNWKLPTGSQTSNNGSTYTMGQLNTLLSKAPGVGSLADYNAKTTMSNDIMSALTSAPYSLVRSGNYSSSGAMNNVGTNGILWSSTAYNARSAYRLYFDASSVYPGTYGGNKGVGFPVRCIVPNAQAVVFNANEGQFSAESLTEFVGNPITLPTENLPTRTGYKFLGWAESAGATLPDRTYTPGETVFLDSDKSLYAVWGSTSFADNSYMQSVDKSSCETTGGQKTLIDARDGKEYLVKKMADGHCWMYQNLALQTSTWVYPFDTNVSEKWQLPTTSDSTFTLDTAHQTTTAQMNNGSHSNGAVTTTSNTGAYYNWPAATATTSAATGDTGDAASDICPKGWRLPNGGAAAGGKNEFVEITKTFNSNSTGNLSGTNRTNFMTAWLGGTNNSSVLVGVFSTDSGVQGSGSRAHWWSRTAGSASNAYDMHIDTSSVGPAGSPSRYYGYSVRCILVGQ